ncbi:MAG: hypothetical protein ABIH76_07155 [Candidatus Bathyarchaeota archaeon]
MEEKDRNRLTVIIIILITISVIFTVASIPGYLRPITPETITFAQPQFIVVFAIIAAILIGIPAGIHRLYVKDYSRIKNVLFFALFGGVTAAFLGEIAMGRPIFMVIPYTVLMLIYAFLYKKFTWWKVALTAYLAGVIIENVMNRSPIQIPTTTWVAFFIYPYFVTKIFENRKKISVVSIFRKLRWTFIASVGLAGLAAVITRDNISPPLIVFFFAAPFIVTFLARAFRRKNTATNS